MKGGIKQLVYVCPRCLGVVRPIDGHFATFLDVESTFCYLGDTLNSLGGCEHAIKARCCVVWGKFRIFLPILTSRHISLPVRGKFFSSNVCSAMLHGGETLAPNFSDQCLRCNDCAMIIWICSAELADHTNKNFQLLMFAPTQVVREFTTALPPDSTRSPAWSSLEIVVEVDQEI